ncbi:MAG: hypothetical protein ACETVW_04230 [Dehalococcoidia bacterium]
MRRNNGRTIIGFPGAEQLTNEELLSLQCDFLILAALESQVSKRNASKVNAKVIAEAAKAL